MEIFGSVLRALSPGSFGALLALLVLSVVVAGVIILILIVTRAAQREIWLRMSVLLLSLAIFGAIAGYAGGLSREAAVGDIIPAVLGIAGGLSAYLFGIDVSRGTVASVGLVAFATALFLGYSYGSDIRSVNDRNDSIRTACIGLFFSPDIYASQTVLDLALGQDGQRYKDCSKYL